MVKEEEKKGYQNLSRINTVQNSGSINDLMKKIRGDKEQTEDFLSRLRETKKKLAAAQAKAAAPVVEVPVAPVVVAPVPVVVEPEAKPAPAPAPKPQPVPSVTYENKRRFDQNAAAQQQGQGGRMPFDQNRAPYDPNRPRPPYDPNRPRPAFDPNRAPYDPNRPRPSYDANRTPYDPNRPRPPFDPNRPRPPFDPNRPRPPFDPNRPRPQGQAFGARPPMQAGAGQRQTTFAASRGNNFRSFAAVKESASVLATTPERQVGNKNKTKQHTDEKQTAVQKGRSFSGKNVFINDGDDFEETRMGSRKLTKLAKKKETFIAPLVEKAVLNSQNISVKDLSEKTGRPVSEIIKKLMILGQMATINSVLDFATCELISAEFGVSLELKMDKTSEETLKGMVDKKEDSALLIKRPPIVAVMGHVDHGKTSLLDAVRKTNIIASEAGGITQRIGAYTVSHKGEKVTFIDTPGHAAFTQMRARGAQVTDIAILVVAADDGIMPQTIEAINHIKSAKVPMIVAINKIDKETANPDRIKQQLAEQGVVPEEWGGDAICVPISAKFNKNIDGLLETILMVAEVYEYKANPNKMASGTVIEAELDKNRGPVASLLIQSGTLEIGDNVVCGLTYGKIRAMFDENGTLVKKAGPSIAVSVLGLNDVPSAGDNVVAIDEKLSKQVIAERKDKIKVDKAKTTSGVSLDDFMSRVNEGKLKSLNVIIKADVQGSVEALKATLTDIKNEEVKVTCVHSGAGAVTESDVLLAEVSSAIIIAFNVKIPAKVSQLAKTGKVQIKEYNVIYQVVDEITAAISGMMTIKYEKVVIGHVEVRAVFKLSSNGIIAGSYVKDGKVLRKSHARVLRDGVEIVDSPLADLKIMKENKAEVHAGFECGIKLREQVDLKEGDIFEIYENVAVKR